MIKRDFCDITLDDHKDLIDSLTEEIGLAEDDNKDHPIEATGHAVHLNLDQIIETQLLPVHEKAGMAAQCSKGCAFCCYQDPLTVPHEAILIASHIKHTFGKKQIRDLQARLQEFVADDNPYMNQTPCPFLDTETASCTIYDVRPLTCRANLSPDKKACEDEFNLPALLKTDSETLRANSKVSFLESPKHYEAIFLAAAGQHHMARGRAVYPLSFTRAIRLLLNQPGRAKMWQRGKDVFRSARLKDRHIP